MQCAWQGLIFKCLTKFLITIIFVVVISLFPKNCIQYPWLWNWLKVLIRKWFETYRFVHSLSEPRAWISKCIRFVEKKISCLSVNSFDFAREKCMSASARVQFFQRKIERITRLTRHVLLYSRICFLYEEQHRDKCWWMNLRQRLQPEIFREILCITAITRISHITIKHFALEWICIISNNFVGRCTFCVLKWVP